MNTILKKHKFYFMHATTYNNLLQILHDKTIKLGNANINNEKILSDGCDVIFLNAMFDDLKNIKSSPQKYVLLLSPKILIDFDIQFTKGWGYQPNYVTIKKHDKNVVEKFDKICEFIKKPDLPKQLLTIDFMQHEFSVKKEIKLKKYLLGIVAINCTKTECGNIRDKLIKDFDYVTIYNNFPDYDHLNLTGSCAM
jgi:hypothetical protein